MTDLRIYGYDFFIAVENKSMPTSHIWYFLL